MWSRLRRWVSCREGLAERELWLGKREVLVLRKSDEGTGMEKLKKSI